MNQILITGIENEKTRNIKQKVKKENKPLSKKTIVIIYAISIILLGICIIVGSIYSKEKINQTVEQNTKPSINIVRNDDDNTLEIKVTHIRGISKLEYRWNNEETKVVNGNNQKEITETIDLIGGKNKLSLEVTEENGQKVTYSKEYVATNLPSIELSAVSNGIKIAVKSENGIDYISYNWDGGEEEKIEVGGQEEYEGIIPTLKGKHMLNLKIADMEGNIETKEQEVIGSTEPTIKITAEYKNGKPTFIIEAKDEDQIATVEITLNSGETEVIEVNEGTYHGEVEMVSGENKLKVVVKNRSGIEKVQGARVKI